MISVERNIAKAVIKNVIKDLGTGDYIDNMSAKRYIRSPAFTRDLAAAGYPDELRDSLKNLVLLSKAQREISAREIIKHLNRHYRKVTAEKNPAGEAGFNPVKEE